MALKELTKITEENSEKKFTQKKSEIKVKITFTEQENNERNWWNLAFYMMMSENAHKGEPKNLCKTRKQKLTEKIDNT